MLFRVLFVSLLMTLGGAQAWALSDLSIDCQTPWPTMSLSVRTTGERVKMQIVFHNGVRYAPIYGGPMTAEDLPFTQQEAAELSKLGDRWTFEGDVKNCRSQGGPDIVFCALGAQEPINGQALSFVSFFTRKVSEESVGVVMKRLKFNLAITLNGVRRQALIDYDAKECTVRSAER